MRSSAVLSVLLSGAAVPASSLSNSESWPWGRKKAPEEATEAKLPETGAAFAKPVALQANGLTVMVKTPASPGCWMRMPSGCPKDPMDTQKWRHDAWAEQEGVDVAGCQHRVDTWNGYCGANDAMMVFVPKAGSLPDETPMTEESRSEPLSALQISATHSWSWPWGKRQDSSEKANTPAVAAHHSIMEARDEAPVASGDGAAGTETPEAAVAERAAFAAKKDGKVKVAHPTRPGCWMRMASGCPKKPGMQTELWRHDTWAEKHGLDESACQSREAVWNGYCGSTDATMAFVAKQ